MENTYQRIWSHDETLSIKDLEKIGGHELCHLALYYASRKEVDKAQKVLNLISKEQTNHSCSLLSETNALVYLFLKEYNAAKACALEALKENPKSVFSQWVLARIELLYKEYSRAIQHYHKILDISPNSDTTLLNIAEAYILKKDFKAAREYLAKVKSSTRKMLYSFFIPFGYIGVRVLWMITVFALLAINPSLFILIYTLTTIALVSIFIKWGIQQGDILLFRSTLFIQSINSIFFMITACGLLDSLR
jgi:tetratricopeptide (TPR) repeat protein